MSAISTITVTVPATTANLGPGFDCIGAALTLYNQFNFTRLDVLPLSSTAESEREREDVRIAVTGLEAERVKTDSSNLAYQAFARFYQQLGQSPPPVAIEINLGVPLARGLGSSATAIVGGLVAANQLADSPLTQLEVMQLAIALEGHPDNVVPALLGGCRLGATSFQSVSATHPASQGWEICEIPWHSQIVPVVAIPDFELSTAEARAVLPPEYSRADAVFNIAHLGLLLRGLETGNRDWLRSALQDKIHQPYRKTLIAGYDAVQSAALAAGAHGLVISGAGPTLLALTDAACAGAVEQAMAVAWQAEGVKAEVRSLSLEPQGAKISAP